MPRSVNLRAAATTALWLWAFSVAGAADLLLDPLRTTGPGSTLFLPVRILTAPGEDLAALQFDLTWDRPGLSAVSTAGATPRASLKRIYRAADGTGRHLVAALNQEKMAAEEQAGTLINLFVLVDSSTPAGTWTLSIDNAVAVSRSGEPVSLRGGRSSVIVDPGLPTEVLPTEGIVHAATLIGSASLAPGALFRLIGPGTDMGSGLTVSVGGVPALVHLAGPRWIEFQAPADTRAGVDSSVELWLDGNLVATFPCQVAQALPGLFTADGSGTGPAVASNGDSEPNTTTRPAPPSSPVTLYGTGFGDNPASISILLSGRPVTVTAVQPDPAGRPGIQSLLVVLPEDAGADPFTQVSAELAGGSAVSPAGVQISIGHK